MMMNRVEVRTADQEPLPSFCREAIGALDETAADERKSFVWLLLFLSVIPWFARGHKLCFARNSVSNPAVPSLVRCIFDEVC